MRALLKDKLIYEMGESILYGAVDSSEPSVEKWKIADESTGGIHYRLDDGFELIDVNDVPEDYAFGKYFYVNGEFVLNEEWKEYKSPEQRIAELEEQIAIHEDNDAELLYQICLLQLGVTEDEML